jgi:hypothetical protein
MAKRRHYKDNEENSFDENSTNKVKPILDVNNKQPRGLASVPIIKYRLVRPLGVRARAPTKSQLSSSIILYLR